MASFEHLNTLLNEECTEGTRLKTPLGDASTRKPLDDASRRPIQRVKLKSSSRLFIQFKDIISALDPVYCAQMISTIGFCALPYLYNGLGNMVRRYAVTLSGEISDAATASTVVGLFRSGKKRWKGILLTPLD